jgi:hypothetical protein
VALRVPLAKTLWGLEQGVTDPVDETLGQEICPSVSRDLHQMMGVLVVRQGCGEAHSSSPESLVVPLRQSPLAFLWLELATV